MRIPSGKTDQVIYFVAVDSTDFVTRKTGLSAFTVFRSRNGAAATSFTTPTITELSSANMPGLYSLLINQDTTIASTSDSEEFCLHITCATMAPVTRTLELYRRDTTSGNSVLVDANGRVDVIKVAGTTQTARDLGGQLDAAISTRMATYTQPTGFLAATFPTTVASPTNITAGTITTVATTTNLTNLPAIPTNWITAAGITAAALNGKGDWLLSSGYTAPLSAAATANAVWDEVVTGHGTASSFGLLVKTDLDATISSRLATSGYTAPTNLSAATIAGAVWDVTLSGHLTAGTTGLALNSAGAAGDPWSTLIPGAYGAGTAGNIVGNNLNASITSRMASYTQPTGFLAATFPTSVASPTNITAGTITTTTNLTNLPSIPANWLTAAGINAGALNGKGDWLLASSYVAPNNISAATIAAAVWDEVVTGHATASTFGLLVKTDLDATISSRLASGSYTAPDNSTISAINAKTTNLPAFPAATSDIPTANTNADALLDRANGIETGYTPRQAIRIMSAVLGGKSTGHPGSPVYRNLPDTADRVTATVSSGNRSAVTLTP